MDRASSGRHPAALLQKLGAGPLRRVQGPCPGGWALSEGDAGRWQ